MSTLNQIHMATDIKSYNDIHSLQSLNGITIEEIEKRARPGFKSYSNSGFLSMNESFLDVLKSDWETVHNLGTTHIELANHLELVWKKAFDRGFGRNYYIIYDGNLKNYNIPFPNRSAFKPTIVSLSITLIASVILTPWSTFLGFVPTALLTYLLITNKQILYISPHSTKGMQDDIFGGEGWNQHMEIANLFKVSKPIEIGKGVINYIRKYGFYEGGGEENQYRVNPNRLVSILTGVSLPN